MMTSGLVSFHFLFFLFVTCLRQIHQIAHGYKCVNGQSIKPVYATDTVRTLLLYIIYVTIWLAAGFRLLHFQGSFLVYALGMTVVLLGLLIRFVALRDLGQFFTSRIAILPNHGLIVSGAYSHLRHPLHLALLLELMGMVIVSEDSILLGLWIALLFLVLHRNRREDRVLLEAFGLQALSYQSQTSAMNPLYSLSGLRSFTTYIFSESVSAVTLSSVGEIQPAAVLASEGLFASSANTPHHVAPSSANAMLEQRVGQ